MARRFTRVFATVGESPVGGGPVAGLNGLALTFLALALANQGLTVASTYLSADVGWSATNQLREDLFRHALGLDMAYHKDRTPGEMIERIDGDVSSVANFFSQFVVRVSGALLMALGVLVLLWREDWRVGLVLTALPWARPAYCVCCSRRVGPPSRS